MSAPKVVLCTLCLNEMEWLPRLYEQHRDWPGLAAWVFVEAADRQYAASNPDMVSPEGLSIDGTTDYLTELFHSGDGRIIHVRHGFCSSENPAQGKCEARTAYLRITDQFRPDFLFVLDADEFYCRQTQLHVVRAMSQARSRWTAYCFRQRHLWRPESVQDRPLTELEVRGGFWDIPHTRGYRWQPGMAYRTNHNTPEHPDGTMADAKLRRLDREAGTPYCVHMGYASARANRAAKNRYYETRGESMDPKRRWYVRSRAAFETWTPGDVLPNGAEVVHYDGEVPEVLR